VTTLDRQPMRARGGHDHGSGVRLSSLANFRTWPARIQSLTSLEIEAIPRIFRIMEASPDRPHLAGDSLRLVRAGSARRVSGRGSRPRTGAWEGVVDVVPASSPMTGGEDGCVLLRLCAVDRD
jgi:hypothetical protein